MTPVYDRDDITLFHGDAHDFAFPKDCAVVTGPPYREDERAAREVIGSIDCAQAFIQWLETERPPGKMPMVAVHAWQHTTGRMQFFYELNRLGVDHPGRIFRHAIVAPTMEIPHPHQIPLAITEGLISMCEKDIMICDPFAGSGTTLVAARNLGRKAVGVEINEAYCHLTIERLKK